MQKEKNISVHNAAKGDAALIVDIEKYNSDTFRQLSNQQNYKTLQEDATLQHSMLFNNTIKILHTHCDEQIIKDTFVFSFRNVTLLPLNLIYQL